ncbi:hypothetical protein UlMin_018122 [Ulmus minor]
MLDGLLKPKFYTKCKTSLKLIKTRLEAIKKKRAAVQKFLKNDIADLLRNGLDTTAYTRAEGLLVEQNMTSCYDLIEHYCGCILSNLSLMQKQRECPEECKEIIPTLNYAAARFADLPELRDLRNLFTEKFGNTLEAFVSKEFVDRLKSKPPTKEMKLQLLHDVANEFNIEWDSKALEQKLYTPPPIQNQHKYGSLGDRDDEKYKAKEAFTRRNEDHGNKLSNIKEYNASEGKETNLASSASKNAPFDRYKLRSEDEAITHSSLRTSSSSGDTVSEDDTYGNRPFYHKFVPPPYLKPKPDQRTETTSLHRPTKSDVHVEREAEAEEDKSKPRSVRRTKLKPPPGREYASRKENEEEEIDELLMHYSNKRSPYDSGISKANPKPSLDQGNDHGARIRGRTSSLPPEQTSPPETTRWPARASSMQPDAGHVHPKLPDYDELAARLAALRKK